MLAIYKAKRMSDWSCRIRHLYRAIVVGMLKPYKKLVAASKRKIQLLT
jgi:hypothetical protein